MSKSVRERDHLRLWPLSRVWSVTPQMPPQQVRGARGDGAQGQRQVHRSDGDERACWQNGAQFRFAYNGFT